MWTPEDLFVSAVNACTLTTFVAFAQRDGLPVESYSSKAEGLLEFVNGSYMFTKVTVLPTIIVAAPEAVAKAERALHEAHKSCIIANSIRASVSIEPVVSYRQDAE